MKLFAGYLLLINLVSFAAMGSDKQRARQNRWRLRERTLFLLAVAGGSIGALLGMHLFRHKTKHLKFSLGIPLILCLQLVLFLLIHQQVQRRAQAPQRAVSDQLSQIQALDARIIRSFISYESLVSDLSLFSDSSQSAEDAILLFFQDFSYRVLSAQTTGDEALVTAQITNIDAAALAHDLGLELTKRRIAAPGSAQADTHSGQDFYQVLFDTLQSHTYESKTTKALFHLTKDAQGAWDILEDEALEDSLTGGLISALADPNLLSPQEVLPLYMERFASMSPEELRNYFQMEDVFSTYSPTYAHTLDALYTEKIAEYFDWSVSSLQTQGRRATGDLIITSIDMPYIMSFYKEALLDYAATTESITDDDTALSDASALRLLKAMEDHARSAEYPVQVEMQNDGTGWQLTVSDSLTDAFLGGMQEAITLLQGD